MKYIGKLYGKIASKYFDTGKTANDWDELEKKILNLKNETEKQRIEGVLLGLSIAKNAWDKGLGREAIYEMEIYYNECLKNLQNNA